MGVRNGVYLCSLGYRVVTWVDWGVGMGSGWLYLAVMVVVATVIALTVLGLSFILGPRNVSQAKLSPYECGISELAPLPKRVSVKFLQVAMLFLIFDVEAVAFYPLAVLLGKVVQSRFLLCEIVVFMVVLMVGYVYVWRKGGFRWVR